MIRVLSCALMVMLSLTACGKEPEPAAAAAAAEAPPPAEQSVPVTEAEPRTPVNELTEPAGSSDGETVEAATSSTSPIAAAVAATTPAPPAGDLQRWTAGKNFIAYPVAQPVSTPPGSVEIVEGFWYGCGACFGARTPARSVGEGQARLDQAEAHPGDLERSRRARTRGSSSRSSRSACWTSCMPRSSGRST